MEITSNFSELITDKKKKNIWRESIFLITINSNKSYNSRDMEKLNSMEKIKECFNNLAHKLFNKDNVFKLLRGVEGTKENKSYYEPEKDIIKNIDVNTQLEANLEVRGFIHLHSTIKVIHQKKIQVNLELLKRVIYKYTENCLTIEGQYYKPYINIKGRSTNYEMVNYAKDN